MAKDLLFLGLLLPPEVSSEITAYKQECADDFHSRRAFNSPPHITVFPPFKWKKSDRPLLETHLAQFAQTQGPIPITLDGFNCFRPRVIYVDVVASAELCHFQHQLTHTLGQHFQIQDQRYGDRPFTPHVTIAFKDLTKTNFLRAWERFRDRPYGRRFTLGHFCLLRYRGQRWEPEEDFPLGHGWMGKDMIK